MNEADFADPVAVIRGLAKSFGSVVALRAADLTVRRGEVIGLVGPNGAGKSTLIKCIAGLLRPDRGTLDLHKGEAQNALGFVYESDTLPLDMTVEACMRCEASALGVSPMAVSATMAKVGLASLRRRAIRGLSLGNRRRLALALALLTEPALLVLDEPTNGLDVDGLQLVRELVIAQRHQGRSVIFSSHTMSEVELLADRLVVISRGEFIFDGQVSDLCAITGVDRLQDAYEITLRRGGN